MNSETLQYIGKSMYDLHTFKGYKRYVVFRARCLLHRSCANDLLDFFSSSELRHQILRANPGLFEQATRSFFYYKSSWEERKNLIKLHLEALEKIFKPDLLQMLYAEHKDLILWQDTYQGQPLILALHYEEGQRKEGCLSLMLWYGEEKLYQIIFWIGKGPKGEFPVIYVGALQGPKNGSEIIRGLTKAFFGYRTKNLIFYGLRDVAKCIGAKAIYGVTNEGYYAMNHIRLDRKLKTSFSDFWQECEGQACEDVRFYKMPVEETRKSMEEIKASKRAQYRRRFEKLDEIDKSIANALAPFKK